MNHLDLFSGIGGFHLAGDRVWGDSFNTVAHVEQDKFCQKILKKHWPDVPIFDDIKEYKYERSETIDLLTGGFPCQPFSVAGKQRGKEDDRFLWHEMLRIIKESKPSWVIGENVTGIINMELDNCITELESEGYEVQTFIIPACGVDARHRRYRVWIVAHSNKDSESNESMYEGERQGKLGIVTNSEKKRLQGVGARASRNQVSQTHERSRLSLCGSGNGAIWPVEPDVVRVAHGVPFRTHRLKALGNAIVPQVVMPIMQAIKEINDINDIPTP